MKLGRPCSANALLLRGMKKQANKTVFMQFSTGSRWAARESVLKPGRVLGAVHFELNCAELPKTCENFVGLCTGDYGTGGTGARLCFKGIAMHRIIPGFLLQGGDVQHGDGTGGDSIFGRQFGDEGFYGKHSKAGVLSMANMGPDTNSSQFFITLAACAHLDKKNVAFGRVVHGMEVVVSLAGYGSACGDTSERITVSDCGVLN